MIPVEQEIAAGALAMPDAGDHVFCFFRRIVDMPRNSSAAGFVELIKLDPGDPATWTTDPDSEARVKALKDTLRRALPGNCFEYEAKWTGSGGVASITTGHLDQLGEDVYSTLAGIINAEFRQRRSHRRTGSRDRRSRPLRRRAGFVRSSDERTSSRGSTVI